MPATSCYILDKDFFFLIVILYIKNMILAIHLGYEFS